MLHLDDVIVQDVQTLLPLSDRSLSTALQVLVFRSVLYFSCCRFAFHRLRVNQFRYLLQPSNHLQTRLAQKFLYEGLIVLTQDTTHLNRAVLRTAGSQMWPPTSFVSVR